MNFLSSALFVLLLAALAGAVLPTQAGINSLLAKHLAGPVWAAFISFCVGALVLLMVLIFSEQSAPEIDGVSHLQWWYFSGGVLGVVYVLIAIFAAPLIGATQLIVMVISGQVIMSILLDHYGLFGFSKQVFDWQKFAGLGLMVLGVLLIKR